MTEYYYKYPRTPHLPWSPGATNDDVYLAYTSVFEGREVVVTLKMDGENTTMYRDHIHARSLDSGHHPSRAWVKGLHGAIAHSIPEGWRFCGENLFAEHSIRYEALPSYFMLFSVWDEQNRCLSWNETEEWAALLDLTTVPVLYRGRWNEATVRAIPLDPTTHEGYVVRTTDGFAYPDFGRHVAKWVRPAHVQTDQHWMNRPVVPNGLRGDDNV
jgi:hypothetical protein